MNPLVFKKFFPWFAFKDNSLQGNRIYFDNAATSQKPQSVINAELNFYREQNASVHRGLYDVAEFATSEYEQIRAKVATFINAKYTEEIIFSSGATDSINQFAVMMESCLKSGDEIIVTQAEHHANLIPWQQLAKKTGAILKFFPLNCQTFTVEQNAIDLITLKTKIIAVTHSSNVLGPIWQSGQLEAIIERAHVIGATVLVDAAASIAHQKLDTQKLNADVVVFSGHKMLAPTGIGVLYIKKSLAESLEPVRFGGSMLYSVSYEQAMWAQMPKKFEAGTPPIAQVMGLGAAIDFYNEFIKFEELKKHEVELCAYLIELLATVDGIRILGNYERMRVSGHLVTFVVAGIHAHDIAAYLNTYNIMVRAGHHCAQPLANLLQAPSSVRVSFFGYNTKEEIDVFIGVLRSAIKALRV